MTVTEPQETTAGIPESVSLDDFLTIAVRAWPVREEKKKPANGQTDAKTKPFHRSPVKHVLVIDTETTTDVRQSLTFGSARYGLITYSENEPAAFACERECVFYADDLPETDPAGFAILSAYCQDRPDLDMLPLSEFVEKYVRYYCERKKTPSGHITGTATLVMFNMSFDISRLAIGYGNGRERNYGAFSFQWYPGYDKNGSPFRRRVIVRHLDSKKSIVNYGTLREDGIPENEKADHHGQFLDVRMLIWAMRNESVSLKRGCDLFGLPPELSKTHAESHGTITPAYIDYNRQDVNATAQLAAVSLDEFYRHPITLQPTKAFSPASIAKSYLKAMGISPMLERPYVIADPVILGNATSTFYGGRAECKIRNAAVPIAVCDFTSMYCTVNVLMNLWEHLTRPGSQVTECTDELRSFLGSPDLLSAVLDRSAWPKFTGLVLLRPDGDILPCRARYAPDQYNLSVSPVHATRELWYTIPDVIASVLLTGRVPEIVRAIRFEPVGRKLRSLLPVQLGGLVTVDPRNRDFFREAVEQRQNLKSATKTHPGGCSCVKCGTGRFLKVLGNSGSYGIFVEMLSQAGEDPETVTVTGSGTESWTVTVTKPETAQPWCYPPIGSVITGAARLMLAITERLVTDAGGSWLFCDTDSMAIVANADGSLIPMPGGTHETGDGRPAIRALTWEQVAGIRDRINALNPYTPTVVRDVLKLEAGSPDDPVYGYAISAKRYALFRYDEDGRPVVPAEINGKRAYSEHGLGLYLNPADMESPDRDWIHQLWQHIINQAHGLDSPDPEWINRPAISRSTLSSPHLMNTVRDYNDGKPYAEIVKPFNFVLLVSELRRDFTDRPQRLIAPYDPDPSAWDSIEWRDLHDPESPPVRVTVGKTEPGTVRIMSMRHIQGGYRSHPESKMNGPDGKPCHPGTTGVLTRRVVRADSVRHIGKEANRIEDVQSHMVALESDVIADYTSGSENRAVAIAAITDLPSRRIAELARDWAKEIENEIRVSQGKARGQIRFEIPAGLAGPDREQWIREYLDEFATDIHERCGFPVYPDHKTVQRWRDGRPVSNRNAAILEMIAARNVAHSAGFDLSDRRQAARIGYSPGQIRPATILTIWEHARAESIRSCKCGCGAGLSGRSEYASATCRKRVSRGTNR